MPDQVDDETDLPGTLIRGRQMTQHCFCNPAMVVVVLLTFISLQAAAEDGANQAQLAAIDQASAKAAAALSCESIWESLKTA